MALGFTRADRYSPAAFTMYGGFWMSYATIFIPGSGISTAYADAANDEATALGIYLFMWFIVTFLHLWVSPDLHDVIMTDDSSPVSPL